MLALAPAKALRIGVKSEMPQLGQPSATKPSAEATVLVLALERVWSLYLCLQVYIIREIARPCKRDSKTKLRP